MQAYALSRFNQGEISMSTIVEQRNLEIVNKFCADWSQLSSPVMLPYFTADGKISQWREYWDMATWTKQGGPV